ncbi:MAG: hypothetical protein IKH01_00035 [Prevotella sp.]|nr:hypothetical protein [Prevotella sp.]
MQQHIYYIKFALRFADMQIPELVTVFNAQVQNRSWSSMRAYHDQALVDEFQNRGIDVSAVSNSYTISFSKPVKYDIYSNQLIAID